MKWISVKERLPEAEYGAEGEPPRISEDVAVLFEAGESRFNIANYDHEAKHWSLPNKRFDQPDADPTHWCPLPAPPDEQQ